MVQENFLSWYTPTYVVPSHPIRLEINDTLSLLLYYTRKTWVYFLKEKSEAFEVFKKFKVMVEKTIGYFIKALRSDRGGEYMSTSFINFCDEQGVRRFLTSPYSPQQNRVAERKNQTILNMVRSMLKSKNMPKELWAEVV
ncbi:retrovirus-related pol polyprotein from transposon TNT 1-94 [Tanacetum coccineum]